MRLCFSTAECAEGFGLPKATVFRASLPGREPLVWAPAPDAQGVLVPGQTFGWLFGGPNRGDKDVGEIGSLGRENECRRL
jgi:hypothetical protein